MLLYSRFFPPRCPDDPLFWYMWRNINDWPRVIKYSWQRARRGWADCDNWSMDSWFCTVVPQLLEDLAKKHMGTPIVFALNMDEGEKGFDPETGKEITREGGDAAWTKTLKQMAKDLRAMEDFEKYWYGEYWYGTDEVVGAYETGKFDDCYNAELQATQRTYAALEAFKTYFFSLWD